MCVPYPVWSRSTVAVVRQHTNISLCLTLSCRAYSTFYVAVSYSLMNLILIISSTLCILNYEMCILLYIQFILNTNYMFYENVTGRKYVKLQRLSTE